MSEVSVVQTGVNNVVWIKENSKRILATKNLTPGISYYKESLIRIKDVEYREWIPYKSKLGAVIYKGLDVSFLNTVKRILYLGAATGTTISHLSDIVAYNGIIYGVEIAPRVMLEFINRVITHRKNVVPLFFDARLPSLYQDLIDYPVDLVYCDVAQPDQTKIAIVNSQKFLKAGGYLLYAIKARSIDATKEPRKIYEEEVRKIEKEGFKVYNVIELEPYEKDHAMVYARLL
ncbi:MAG: fibrillarin-like rRNA/tRNA 2'-O-methyltransferase [Candidatus Geothermarchaeota archaeon]